MTLEGREVELSARLNKLLDETPETKLSPLIWANLIEPEQQRQVDTMLRAGLTPSWIVGHMRAPVPGNLRLALFNCLRWRSRNILSDA